MEGLLRLHLWRIMENLRVKMFKRYQKGHVKDGEESFAHWAGEVSPVESDARVAEPLHQQQLALLLRWCRMTGPGRG